MIKVKRCLFMILMLTVSSTLTVKAHTAGDFYELYGLERPMSVAEVNEKLKLAIAKSSLNAFNSKAVETMTTVTSSIIPSLQKEIEQANSKLKGLILHCQGLEVSMKNSNIDSDPLDLFSMIDEWREVKSDIEILQVSLLRKQESFDSLTNDLFETDDKGVIEENSMGEEIEALKAELSIAVDFKEIGDLDAIPVPVLTYENILRGLTVGESTLPEEEEEGVGDSGQDSSEGEESSESEKEETEDEEISSDDNGEREDISETIEEEDGVEEIIPIVNDDFSSILWRAQELTPVVSILDGQVLEYSSKDNILIVEHGAGILIYYYNIGTCIVTSGEFVYQNQKLGLCGDKGYSTLKLFIQGTEYPLDVLTFHSLYEGLIPSG